LEKRLASSGVKFEDDPLTHYPITSDPPFLDSGWLVEATTKLWRFGRAHALCLDARLLIRDDLDATERLLTQIESVAPNLPDTAYLRALVAQGRNDLAAARDLASQAARGDPLHPEYISFLEAVSSACADRREAGVSEPDPPPLPDAPLSIEQSAQHDAEQT
jgi:hypothetical protein